MRLIDADKIIFREIDEIGGEYEPYLGCSKSQIDSLPSVTPQLSIPEVTALAEWTEKLTKASEDAYNKGYADGMKAQKPRKGHWIASHIPESILDECSECGFSCGAFTFNYCPNCGAKMESEE